jgi:hypothetical protein
MEKKISERASTQSGLAIEKAKKFEEIKENREKGTVFPA